MTRLEELERYLTGELDDAAADALEDALFATPDDPDLAFMDRVARHGAKLVEHGTYDIGVTRAHLDALAAAGHTVQRLDAGPPGTTRELTVDKHSKFVATVMTLGRTDHARVDVEITLVDHDVTKTIKDVFVDPSDGTIYGLCERPLAELAFGTRAKVRVLETQGARRPLGEWMLIGNIAR